MSKRIAKEHLARLKMGWPPGQRGKSTKPKDLRTPLAEEGMYGWMPQSRARDKFLRMTGRLLNDSKQLTPHERLERAWLAGVAWGRKHPFPRD